MLAELENLRAAQQEAERSQHLYAELFDDAPVGYINLTEKGKIQSANLAAGDLLKTEARWLNDQPMLLLVHREDQGLWRDHLARCKKSHYANVISEMRLLVGAEYRCVELTSRVTALFSNGETLYRTVLRDVTEKNAVEKQLRHNEELLRLVLENAREYAILATDLNRRIRMWNAGAEQLVGFSVIEAMGQLADMIFTEEQRAAGAPEHEARTALLKGGAADERWHLRKDGSRFWGSGVMMAMRDATGLPIGFVKIFRDETTAREAQQALERSRTELMTALGQNEQVRADLEAANRAKDRFLAVLSHELRTPLTPVVMAVQALARRQDFPAQARPVLDMIRRNVKIESHLIDDLLDLTRISRGNLEITPEPMDVHRAITGAIEICESDIAGRNQTLKVDLAATQHRTHADFNRVQQVVWNLLKNASKFTPASGEISVSTQSDAERIAIMISDNGVGILHDVLPMIFEPFTQGGEWVAREYGGLGLGLAISKATVEAHGGTISAESGGREQGATFTVALPLV